MQEYYLKSLQMIKILNIQKEKEYNELLEDYKLLSLESLKFMAKTRSFRKIKRLAEEL